MSQDNRSIHNQSTGNQPAGSNQEEHRLDFFRPDQIAFLVSHPDEFIDAKQGDRLTDEVLTSWAKSIQGLLNQNNWTLREDRPIRCYSFPSVADDEYSNVPDTHFQEEFKEAFSVIVLTVRSDSPEAFANLNAMTNTKRTETKQSLLDLVASMNNQTKTRELDTLGLVTRGVFPNWVASSSASDSGGTGGPGGRPSPYEGDTQKIPFYFTELVAELKETDKNKLNVYGEGDGVNVIILDTAPSEQDLVLAYKELVTIPQKKGDKGHSLIGSLLGPNGKLKLYPATYDEQLRMGNTSLNKHGYKMADHGLFIAGIIHSIVPNATIHLIEVLNQFGVGDLETIARGLAKAYLICRQSNGKAIVNGSLCLDVPALEPEHAYNPTASESILPVDQDLEESLRQQMIAQLDDFKSRPENQSKRLEDALLWVFALKVMCERLGRAGRQIVAAAGNDSKKEENQRKAQAARYPAAFSRVVGVGAIPKDAVPDGNGKYEASSFSNLADKPQQNGIMALGGEEGENNGVLGIYIGEFPPTVAADGSSNGAGWDKGGKKGQTGWAWWSGTSFATPILTGVIASVLTTAAVPPTTQRALEILYDERIIVQRMTPQQEDGIPSSLKQDVPPPGSKWH